jgi:NAD(P)-dependent dehydrogenase (short-subunit alcohol dehydrogenase family)
MIEKSILITGASSGIGYYCAQQLHKRGYKVVASCRKIEDVARLSQEGLTAIQLDLDDSESIAQAVKATLAITGGSLFALFNNGAYGQPGAVEDLSRATLRQQFETNFFGWCELTNLLLPVMIEQQQGRIIQNSSVLGIAAMPFRGAYNASKFALEGITDTLRLELVGTGVYVSLIEPGPIRSQFRQNALAALNANIRIEQSRHTQSYKAAIARLDKIESNTPFTLDPDAVYLRLLHALEAKRPQARYYVTKATYMVGLMKRLLSTHLLDHFMRAISK